MKFILILLVSVSVHGYGQRPKPSGSDEGPNDGGIPWGESGIYNKPSGQWGSQQEQGSWGGPQSEQGSWEHEGSGKKPELTCAQIIPKNAKTSVMAPLVANEVTFESVYPCDSDSKLRQIAFSGVSNVLPETTCNGVFVLTSTGEVHYELTYCDKNGKNRKETAYLTNYTMVSSFNNGNLNYVECGVILKGRCAGDLWIGSGITQVNDPLGCAAPGGISGVSALVRRVEVRGRCSSRCGLGSSGGSLAEPINNAGYAEPLLLAYAEEDAPSAEN